MKGSKNSISEFPVWPAEELNARSKQSCSTCSVGDLCVALGSDQDTLSQLDKLLQVKDSIADQEHVIRQGDPFSGLFAVREGCFKSYISDRDGREQVQGFHFPGELFGFEGISRGHYGAHVIALEQGGVCSLKYSELLRISSCSSSLQQQLFRLFSSRLATQHWRGGDYTASERLSAFLLDVSGRMELRGKDPRSFELLMSRRDIANYLGLATETVSRVFSRFNKQSLISVRRKHVQLLDMDRLRQIAEAVLENVGSQADA